MRRLASFAFMGVALASCGVHEIRPSFRTHDARFGQLGGAGAWPTEQMLCQHWNYVAGARDGWAQTHVSFPETDAERACFTPVLYDGVKARPDTTPPGCAFPDAAARAQLEAMADKLDALAEDAKAPTKLFPCTLSPAERSASSRQNARALRALARDAATYPYAAVIVPGEGRSEEGNTSLVGFLPGDACRALPETDRQHLFAMPIRSARAASALRGNVAPLAIVSGGAVHSRLVEAFAMMHLLECQEQIPAERILVEPCAEHTHTNLRNSGRWLRAMGARVAYLVTDDGIQSDYFQEYTGFELIFGSLDQRSLRDWGYVVGSWRQASVGMKSGFWFTPYRFWAEPREGLGSTSCVDEP